ncbi:MAG: hypothetical protein EOO77_15695 [Oxalobacteraceae bacterium]|nr:MAG: hypothetical protein EOO77_15695 [Oxalobacteraceae bacterium]
MTNPNPLREDEVVLHKAMTEDDPRVALDQQIERLWADNRPRLERLIQYADRCRTRDDRDGEQRYMSEYAKLWQSCSDMSQAIYKPVIDLAMLSPGKQMVVPNAAILRLDQVREGRGIDATRPGA